MKKLILALIRFYRKNISPMKHGSVCRFRPTCSEYALEAVEKYGNKIAVGVDLSDGYVAVKGWTERSGCTADEMPQ